MKKAPGHRKWPDHKVEEERLDRPMRVEVNGEVVAESSDAIRVDEDDHPPRYYFPRSDVSMDRFTDSGRETSCPFKGHGHYLDLELGDRTLEHAAWTYDDTYEEHASLKDRVAFHDAEMEEIDVREVA